MEYLEAEEAYNLAKERQSWAWQEQDAYEKAKANWETLSEKAENARLEYIAAQNTYIEMEEDIDRFERAQVAAAGERFDEVINIMANETGATIQYYANKQELAEADRENLKKLRDQQILDIEEYQKGLDAGAKKHSQRGADPFQVSQQGTQTL